MSSLKTFFGLAALLAASLSQPAAAQGRTRFIAFGDSITAGLGTDESCACQEESCQQLCGYPRRLLRRLTEAGIDAGVLNRGLGAEKTPDGLTRLDTVLEEGGHVLLLMEGTNDITRRISPETTVANLEEMARKAARAGFETVHATLIPRYELARNDADNVLNAEVARRLRDLAYDERRQLVDPFQVFSQTPELFESFYHLDIPNDPVGHPNAAGYDLLAETFFNALTGVDTVPPVLGSFSPPDGSVDVGPLEPVTVRLYDFGSGIDLLQSLLVVNGQVAEVSSVGGQIWQDLVYQPTKPHPPEVEVRIFSRDEAFNTMERRVTSFTTEESGFVGPCVPDATTMCIDQAVADRRFQVTVTWETGMDGGQSGVATAIPLAPIGLRRGGLFTFFGLQNPEILVKVLDGCAINERFWVFVAPTTSLGYELKVIDTVAALRGASRSEYEFVVTNTDGREAPPVSDTSAFDTCSYVSP